MVRKVTSAGDDRHLFELDALDGDIPGTYRLARNFSDLLHGRLGADEGLALDAEAVRLRVEAVLAERGRLTNAEVRRMCGYSRAEVVRLMRSLRDQGLARVEGRGRGAYYAPGPNLQQTGKRRNPRRSS